MSFEAMPAPTRMLVVGGSGFIGRNVVDRAAKLGWQVTSLSLRTRRESLQPNVKILTVDGSIGTELRKALGTSAFEYVVNCGGYIEHTPYFRGGRSAINGHYDMVLNLVEVLDRSVLRSFVNIGSSDEYGNNTAPQMESAREAPITPYSAGKVAATHFLQMLARTEEFPATVLRLFLTYGPGQDKRRLLPLVIQGCLKGCAFPVSEGAQQRDFCFVRDTVDAIFATLARPETKGEVINIASGRPVTIRQLIETVRRFVGRGEPQYGALAYRPGENMSLYGDISKAEMLLDWRPNVSLEEGLRETIRSFEEEA